MQHQIIDLTDGRAGLSELDKIIHHVIDTVDNKEKLRLFRFDSVPSLIEIRERSKKLAQMAAASGCPRALMGCPPWMVTVLSRELTNRGIRPVYSFEKVIQVEHPAIANTPVSVIKHVEFITL